MWIILIALTLVGVAICAEEAIGKHRRPNAWLLLGYVAIALAVIEVGIELTTVHKVPGVVRNGVIHYDITPAVGESFKSLFHGAALLSLGIASIYNGRVSRQDQSSATPEPKTAKG